MGRLPPGVPVLSGVTDGQAHPETSVHQEWHCPGPPTGLSCLVGGGLGNLGVQLAYENHAKPGAGKYPILPRTSRSFLEIPPAPGIGRSWDTDSGPRQCDHLRRRPGGALSARSWAGLVSVHAAEPPSVAGELCLLGHRASPPSGFSALLESSGWDGWICMEEEARPGPPAGVVTAATWQAAHPAHPAAMKGSVQR